MSLTTHSKFYYGFEVTQDNFYLDFDEGGGELTADLQPGGYSLTEFAAEVERALNAAGALDYEVTIDRATRALTISADGDFDLLVQSGSHEGASAYATAGFTGVDRTGVDTYEGDPAGSEYTTQFILQSHVPSDNFRDAAFAVVNKSASGKVEVVSFGAERFVEGNFKFVTDISQGDGSPIRNRETGVDDLLALIRHFTTKAPFEYMPDEDEPSTFETCILELTPDDQKGLRYKLRELYGQGLPGYFETGVLRFRVLGVTVAEEEPPVAPGTCVDPNCVLDVPLATSVDPICGEGTLIGTLFGGAVISGGFLEALGGAVPKGAHWPGDNAVNVTNVGAVRLKWKPNYSGGAGDDTQETLFTIGNAANSNNEIQMYHDAATNLGLVINNSSGGTIINVFLGTFSPVAGTEYEVELNWDGTAARAFIQGVQIGADQSGVSGRTASVDRVVLGASGALTVTADSSYRLFKVFKTVQHTANYTP